VTRIAWLPIAVEPETLVVLDAAHRLYAGLSRDESYYHVVQPTQFDLVDHNTDEILRPAGTLVCTCRGFQSHGYCYQAAAAIAFEGAKPDPLPAFLRQVAPETELERLAARG
jgi:hypothetical protein